MCFGFQRYYRLHHAFPEEVGALGMRGGELHGFRSFHEGHVVLVCGNESVRVLLRRLLDHFEQGEGFLLAVDYECAVENLVAAVL